MMKMFFSLGVLSLLITCCFGEAPYFKCDTTTIRRLPDGTVSFGNGFEIPSSDSKRAPRAGVSQYVDGQFSTDEKGPQPAVLAGVVDDSLAGASGDGSFTWLRDGLEASVVFAEPLGSVTSVVVSAYGSTGLQSPFLNPPSCALLSSSENGFTVTCSLARQPFTFIADGFERAAPAPAASCAPWSVESVISGAKLYLSSFPGQSLTLAVGGSGAGPDAALLGRSFQIIARIPGDPTRTVIAYSSFITVSGSVPRTSLPIPLHFASANVDFLEISLMSSTGCESRSVVLQAQIEFAASGYISTLENQILERSFGRRLIAGTNYSPGSGSWESFWCYDPKPELHTSAGRSVARFLSEWRGCKANQAVASTSSSLSISILVRPFYGTRPFRTSIFSSVPSGGASSESTIRIDVDVDTALRFSFEVYRAGAQILKTPFENFGGSYILLVLQVASNSASLSVQDTLYDLPTRSSDPISFNSCVGSPIDAGGATCDPITNTNSGMAGSNSGMDVRSFMLWSRALSPAEVSTIKAFANAINSEWSLGVSLAPVCRYFADPMLRILCRGEDPSSAQNIAAPAAGSTLSLRAVYDANKSSAAGPVARDPGAYVASVPNSVASGAKKSLTCSGGVTFLPNALGTGAGALRFDGTGRCASTDAPDADSYLPTASDTHTVALLLRLRPATNTAPMSLMCARSTYLTNSPFLMLTQGYESSAPLRLRRTLRAAFEAGKEASSHGANPELSREPAPQGEFVSVILSSGDSAGNGVGTVMVKHQYPNPGTGVEGPAVVTPFTKMTLRHLGLGNTCGTISGLPSFTDPVMDLVQVRVYRDAAVTSDDFASIEASLYADYPIPSLAPRCASFSTAWRRRECRRRSAGMLPVAMPRAALRVWLQIMQTSGQAFNVIPTLPGENSVVLNPSPMPAMRFRNGRGIMPVQATTRLEFRAPTETAFLPRSASRLEFTFAASFMLIHNSFADSQMFRFPFTFNPNGSDRSFIMINYHSYTRSIKFFYYDLAGSEILIIGPQGETNQVIAPQGLLQINTWGVMYLVITKETITIEFNGRKVTAQNNYPDLCKSMKGFRVSPGDTAQVVVSDILVWDRIQTPVEKETTLAWLHASMRIPYLDLTLNCDLLPEESRMWCVSQRFPPLLEAGRFLLLDGASLDDSTLGLGRGLWRNRDDATYSQLTGAPLGSSHARCFGTQRRVDVRGVPSHVHFENGAHCVSSNDGAQAQYATLAKNGLTVAVIYKDGSVARDTAPVFSFGAETSVAGSRSVDLVVDLATKATYWTARAKEGAGDIVACAGTAGSAAGCTVAGTISSSLLRTGYVNPTGITTARFGEASLTADVNEISVVRPLSVIEKTAIEAMNLGSYSIMTGLEGSGVTDGRTRTGDISMILAWNRYLTDSEQALLSNWARSAFQLSTKRRPCSLIKFPYQEECDDAVAMPDLEMSY